MLSLIEHPVIKNAQTFWNNLEVRSWSVVNPSSVSFPDNLLCCIWEREHFYFELWFYGEGKYTYYFRPRNGSVESKYLPITQLPKEEILQCICVR